MNQLLPPIYPRNIPFALNSLWLLGFLGGCAFLTVGYVLPFGFVTRSTMLGIGISSLFVLGRHGATVLENVRQRQYEEHTALSTLGRRRWLLVGIFAFLVPVL